MSPRKTSAAFAQSMERWYAAQGQELRNEVQIERRRGRVDIDFARFSNLRGTVRSEGVSVAAMYRGRCYDLVYDDITPAVEIGDGQWHCRLCDEPKVYMSRIALWEDHLFNPFREWLLDTLKKNSSVEFIEHGGITTARLRLEARVPRQAVAIRDRARLARAKLADRISRGQLAGFDIIIEKAVGKVWTDPCGLVDLDGLICEALAAASSEATISLGDLTSRDLAPIYLAATLQKLGDDDQAD